VGTLFVVPTPLGNLEDITLRALRILRESALIAAEDTRRSRTLLRHFDIPTRMESYHQHNKRSAIPQVMERLRQGQDVALISDAGMPSVSDPGFELVRAAIDAGLPVDVLPGPSAVTASVVFAALPAVGFIFMGFPPRRRKQAQERLRAVASLPYSLVLFEAPRRLASTLDLLLITLGNRAVAAVRELSKLHQEVIRTDLRGLIDRVSEHEPRGEWTIVVGPAIEWESGPPDASAVAAALLRLADDGVPGREAVHIVSRVLDRPRTEVYRLWLTLPKA